MNPRIIITGAGGYLGSVLQERFPKQGWDVVRWSRQGGDIKFVLGEEPPAIHLAGARALIHCAYDFGPSTRSEARRVNLAGSLKLLAAACAAKIPRIVFISTMSAFSGCVSIYGQIKLEVEQFCLPRGVMCVRPGLLWSDRPRGIYQRLENMTRQLPLLPLLGGGRQKLAFSHAEDLAAGLEKFCRGHALPPPGPLVTAFPQLFTFRRILETLARRQGKKPLFVPIPTFPIFWGLRLAELFRIPAPFKSDSLTSLLHQDPNPAFSNLMEFRAWPPA